MQLVQDQELQVLAVAENRLVARLAPGQQQLQHHEIGKQDVRRCRLDLGPPCCILLAGIERNRNRFLLAGTAQPLVDLLKLAVGERVHRIDHDGTGASWLALGPGAQNPINDRQEVAQRFAGTGAGGDNEASAIARLRERIDLMPMKRQAAVLGVRGCTLVAKDGSAARMQLALIHQPPDTVAGLEARIELDHRLGPEPAGVVCRINRL